jgi:hypothetical protein
MIDAILDWWDKISFLWWEWRHPYEIRPGLSRAAFHQVNRAICKYHPENKLTWREFKKLHKSDP